MMMVGKNLLRLNSRVDYGTIAPNPLYFHSSARVVDIIIPLMSSPVFFEKNTRDVPKGKCLARSLKAIFYVEWANSVNFMLGQS